MTSNVLPNLYNSNTYLSNNIFLTKQNKNYCQMPFIDDH